MFDGKQTPTHVFGHLLGFHAKEDLALTVLVQKESEFEAGKNYVLCLVLYECLQWNIIEKATRFCKDTAKLFQFTSVFPDQTCLPLKENGGFYVSNLFLTKGALVDADMMHALKNGLGVMEHIDSLTKRTSGLRRSQLYQLKLLLCSKNLVARKKVLWW